MSVDLKAATPDTTIPATGAFLFGADSQSASAPSVYRIDTTILQYLDSLAHTITVNGALSAPATSLTGTWITGGSATTTKPQFLIEPSGTTSTGWSTAGTGIGVNAASGFTGNLIDLQLNGAARLSVTSAGNGTFAGTLTVGAAKFQDYGTGQIGIGGSGADKLYVSLSAVEAVNIPFAWSASIGSRDLALYRDAANVLAQRNGTSWQTFRVYSTYADASNHEALEIRQSGSNWEIGHKALGTGPSNRGISLLANGALSLGANGGAKWNIPTTGHFLAVTDNANDIGASGASRPRNIYLGGHIIIGDGGRLSRQSGFGGIVFNADNTISVSTGGSDVSCAGNFLVNASAKSLGYGTGSGGAVTQATSRTTGVTLNKSNGAITLVSAAGSTTPTSFTVTNSAVAATDTIILSQQSGTDLYDLKVTAVAAGSFNITFNTTGGTTTEQPVINFAVIKAVAA